MRRLNSSHKTLAAPHKLFCIGVASGIEVRSNLLLQIVLYFNVWFYPVWIWILLCNVDAKYCKLNDVYQVISVAVFIAVIILEGVRLYLGYLGNLAIKIPELATFWLISTLLQLPLEMFLILDPRNIPELNEKIANIIAIIFLLAEITTGTLALRNLADSHAKRFYIAQLYKVDDKLD
ncbi:transmembrane protein 17-like isoform X2 [Leptopilina boulardi]|uniref:transmembrane protein 17-like isoform X2 n=1 Tax=Leptopilina boulardi TaxID=63433 RepID=UPI0021F607FB|nr:transmembrane protein 17-like isoform X2 [Leptopilina boulardi]